MKLKNDQEVEIVIHLLKEAIFEFENSKICTDAARDFIINKALALVKSSLSRRVVSKILKSENGLCA